MADLANYITHLTAEDRELLLQKLGLTSEQFEKQFNNIGDESPMDISYYKLSKQLLYYVPPILLIIGTIGNLLSFAVLMRRPMRRVSAYTYLSVLSIADTLVLYVGLLRLWIGEITTMDIRDYSDWTCKVINVVGYTVSDYSVWLLIAVTVERYIATVHSLWASSMCTLSRARKVIVGILLLLILINCHFFVTTEVRDYNTTLEGVPTCDGKEKYHMFIADIWPWIDAIIYSFLPFVVIMSLNGCIIYNVAKARKSRDKLNASMIVSSHKVNSTPRRNTSHHEGSTRITLMLLTISFTFLVTTLPMNISSIISALLKAENNREASKFKLARTITELLMYTNHSINFFLYLVTGQKFRQQLSILMCHYFPITSSRWGGSVYSQVEAKKIIQYQCDNSNGMSGENRLQLPTEMTIVTDDRFSIRSEGSKSSIR